MNTRSLIKHKNRCKQHFLIFIIFSRVFFQSEAVHHAFGKETD